MQAYSSDQEQIDAIKKWLRENGLAIFVGVAVGFGGLYGWQSWQSYVNKRAEQASALYSQILIGMDNAQTEGVAKAADELIKNYSATPYAGLAALAASKVAAVDGNDALAKEHLQWVIDNGKQVQLVPLAKVRLAQLYLLDKDLEAAAALIERGSYPDSYAARIAELQGDLHVLRGETVLARNAYNAALNAALPAQNRDMIQIKLDALGPATDAEASAKDAATAEPTTGAVE
jgi:predicted negative regulator of RcsB-dependent stress response